MICEQVNLGVIEANPSSTAGAAQILRKLEEHVPDDFPVPVHGDGLSVMRMSDAQLSLAWTDDERDQLGLCLPVSQEFHKRGILLQVVMLIGKVI